MVGRESMTVDGARLKIMIKKLGKKNCILDETYNPIDIPAQIIDMYVSPNFSDKAKLF